MAKRDYYEVLGLRRDATPDQVRSAYRRMARKYHPDVNKAADAADRFKEATEAYDVLSDPQKRKMYDQFGFEGPAGAFAGRRGAGGPGPAWAGAEGVRVHFEDLFGRGGGEFMGMSLEEILQSLGGARPRGRRAAGQRAPSAGADIEHPLEIDWLDAVRGTTAELVLRREGGRGETLRVRIPAGVREGQRIRLRGRGQGGGDLYIVVRLREHPYFRREGDDIYVDLPISVTEAVLGGTVEAPTLEGPRQVKVPPGSGSSRRLRLRGLGVPSAEGGPPGDQYVVLKVVVPTSVSPQGERLLRQFQEVERFDPRKDVPWKR